MATSKVAPPHSSRLKSPAPRRAVAGAMRSRSWLRTRVASSDWCASRMVVSVKRSPFRSRAQAASPSGPRASSTSRLPGGGGEARSTRGTGASRSSLGRSGFWTPGEPFTTTSPIQESSFEPRSFFWAERSSSGWRSMKEVSARPWRKSGWVTTFSRKGMLVFTPRIRNSCRERCMMRADSWKVSPQVQTFTSRES